MKVDTGKFETDVKEMMSGLFGVGGQVLATLVVPDDGSYKLLCVEPLMSDESKPVMWQMIRTMRMNIPMFAMASEMWIATSEDGKMLDCMPRDHPDKIEILGVMIYEGLKGPRMWRAEIIRKGDDVSLGPWSLLNDTIGQLAGDMIAPPVEAN